MVLVKYQILLLLQNLFLGESHPFVVVWRSFAFLFNVGIHRDPRIRRLGQLFLTGACSGSVSEVVVWALLFQCSDFLLEDSILSRDYVKSKKGWLQVFLLQLDQFTFQFVIFAGQGHYFLKFFPQELFLGVGLVEFDDVLWGSLFLGQFLSFLPEVSPVKDCLFGSIRELQIQRKSFKFSRIMRLSTCKVDKVSEAEETEGEMQTMNQIFPFPLRESERTRVSFEFLNGMCVLDFSMSAEMQCPRQERLPLMDVNSVIRRSFSSLVRSWGILNFSDPARSTIRSLCLFSVNGWE